VITNSFLWDRRKGSVTIIEIPGSSNRQLFSCRINSTAAQGINNMGQIVGSFLDTNNIRHGFLWQAGTFTQIDVPGAISTEANGINNSSQIVGAFVVPEAPPETGRITRGYVTTPVDSGPLARFGVPAVQ
jgi:probable HAF family extracellular repeat protein